MDEVAILEALGEGERKAVARSSEVAAFMLKNSGYLPVVLEAFSSADETIVAHAAHALHTVFRSNACLLHEHTDRLVQYYHINQWEVLEQLGKILPGLPLTDAQVRTVADRAEQVLRHHKSAIARAFSLQCLVTLALQRPYLKSQAESALKFATVSKTKALQARARKLLALPARR